MTLLTLIVVLVVIGVIMWAINAYIPMSAGIKKLLNVAVIIFAIVWLLTAFGLIDVLNMRIGK
jgi:hypothetical protein